MGRPDLKAEHRPGHLGLPAISGSAFGLLLELLQRTCSEEQDEVRIEEPGEEEKEARLQGGVRMEEKRERREEETGGTGEEERGNNSHHALLILPGHQQNHQEQIRTPHSKL